MLISLILFKPRLMPELFTPYFYSLDTSVGVIVRLAPLVGSNCYISVVFNIAKDAKTPKNLLLYKIESFNC